MLKLVLLLGVVAGCWAQEPKPCESPKQWEGVRLKRFENRDVFERARYTYDAVNTRIRETELIEAGTEKTLYDVWHFYKEMKTYRLNTQTKTCNVSTPGHPFFEIGAPTGSKLMFESEIGAAQIPDEHLTIQNWYIKFSNGAEYDVTVSSPDCIPVGAYYRNGNLTEVERFFDIHPGIKNATAAFTLPPECTGL
ncbi:hypothetical protein ACF0H5_002510 [Mactra antiquata]